MTTSISKDKNTLTITWNLADIIEYDKSYGDGRNLTLEYAQEVLWLMDENYNQDEGLTWDHVEGYREDMLRDDED